tara:strand:- start:230 stop:385 length:156 start_codon:yes stop_codon:yes gene_type:complete
VARVVVCDFGFAKKKAIAVGARFGACDLGVLLRFEKQSELVLYTYWWGILA